MALFFLYMIRGFIIYYSVYVDRYVKVFFAQRGGVWGDCRVRIYECVFGARAPPAKTAFTSCVRTNTHCPYPFTSTAGDDFPVKPRLRSSRSVATLSIGVRKQQQLCGGSDAARRIGNSGARAFSVRSSKNPGLPVNTYLRLLFRYTADARAPPPSVTRTSPSVPYWTIRVIILVVVVVVVIVVRNYNRVPYNRRRNNAECVMLL